MLNTIKLTEVAYPMTDNSGITVPLTDETIKERKDKLLTLMKQENLDSLVIYGDLEHGGNFSYLTGFVTRFEEGVLILHETGEAVLMLGNENTKMAQHARIRADLIHCPFFSLPDQPMDGEVKLETLFEQAGLTKASNVGVVGWKMFTAVSENNRTLFDVPSYLLSAIQSVVTKGTIENRSDLFIDAAYGAKTTNNANEIAHYEFGSSLASDCVLETIEAIEVGKSEMELGTFLTKYGQNPTVVPIAATGERFEQANLYPSPKRVQLGDKMSITTGFKGGLASRGGYAVSQVSELPSDQQEYLERVAKPYYNAVVNWLEAIDIGVEGQELYQLIEEVLPKSRFGWHLNPGHLTADEEWMSSPIKKDSAIPLKSGMLFQIDIIPSVKGYGGVGCENGIALADEVLRNEIKQDYPDLWARIVARRSYLKEVLHIQLHDSVLPLSSGVAFYNPFFLNKTVAFTKEEKD